MESKTFILISVPRDFERKFIGFIHNLNMLNSDREPPVVIEKKYSDEEANALEDTYR